MIDPPSGWYADPATRHAYRFWNGRAWTDQVVDAERSGIDPIPLEPHLASTPPGPGTHAPGPRAPRRAPASRQRSGNAWVGVVVVLVAIFVVAAVAAALFADGSDDSEPDTPATTEATDTPETTESPATTATPETTEASDSSEATDEE